MRYPVSEKLEDGSNYWIIVQARADSGVGAAVLGPVWRR